MRKTGLSVILCAFVLLTKAIFGLQNIDSLKILYESNITDLPKKHSLAINISDYYLHDSPKTSLYYALESYKISLQLNESNLLWESEINLTKCYLVLDSLKQAFSFAQSALTHAESTNLDENIAISLMQAGKVAIEMHDYESAGQYLFKSYKLFEKSDIEKEFPQILNSIGFMYYELRQLEKARDYYSRCLDYASKLNDDYMIARSFNNLAAIYESEDNYELAKEYFTKASRLNKKIGMEKEMALNYMNIGIININHGNTDSSLVYLRKSLDLFKQFEDWENIGYTYIELSRAYNSLNEMDSAYYFAKKAAFLSKQNKNILMKRTAFYRLQQYFKSIGIEDSANYYGIKYFMVEDSLKMAEQLSKVTNLELKFNFEKQQQELLLEQQRKNYISIISIGSLVLIVIIIFLLYSRLKVVNKNNRLIKMQMERDLETKNKELATGVMYTIEKNKVLSELTTELLDIERKAVKDETRDAIHKISKKIKESVDSKAWEEFELRFNQVHKEFYDTLAKMHPELSLNEKRLCAFLRLDMSSKEISKITGQSLSAIEMARIRLRKKLGISNTNTNLNNFLSKY